MKEKQIQISESLFVNLCQYFLLEDRSESRIKLITSGLNEKLNRTIDHDLYTRSKVAATAEEREQARKDYLDRKGITEEFRW